MPNPAPPTPFPPPIVTCEEEDDDQDDCRLTHVPFPSRTQPESCWPESLSSLLSPPPPPPPPAAMAPLSKYDRSIAPEWSCWLLLLLLLDDDEDDPPPLISSWTAWTARSTAVPVTSCHFQLFVSSDQTHLPPAARTASSDSSSSSDDSDDS